MDELLFIRTLIRHEMLVERGGEMRAVCDQCGAQAPLECHELVNRGRTVHNDAARALSYQPELMVMLCQKCHGNAHNPDVRDTLFQLNYDRYGYLAVLAAFTLLSERSENLDITLPEPLPGASTCHPLPAGRFEVVDVLLEYANT